MRREIIYFRILAMLTFLGLASCQTEELYVEKSHFGKGNGVKSSYLKGNEAKRVVEMLSSKLSEGTKIKVLSTNSNSMRTDSGVIDFNTILQVIDTLGIKNYTFKVVNHPDDDLKTFHNLVLTEKINELEATILKYEMTDSFAQNYYANLDDFNDFQGKIVASSILIQDPCIPVVVNYPSNTGPGSPDNPDPNNPVGSIPISSTGCTTINLSFVCTDCNSLYTNWDEYRGSVCGNGSYGLNIVVSYVQSISCRSAEDPCNPSGSIGVLQPEIDCNTSKEDLKAAFPNLSDGNAEILANVINDYGKEYGIDTNYKLRHFLSQIAHETGGLGNLNVVENMNYSTADRLLVVFDKYFSYTDPNRENPDSYVGNPSKVGNYVYKSRMGNGNVQSQDGYKFRGRGLLQLTGKENYINFQNHYNDRFESNINLNSNPEMVSNNTEMSIISALWFFKNNVINKTNLGANIDETVKEVTKKVNGGKKGLIDRIAKHTTCVQIIDCITQ